MFTTRYQVYKPAARVALHVAIPDLERPLLAAVDVAKLYFYGGVRALVARPEAQLLLDCDKKTAEK